MQEFGENGWEDGKAAIYDAEGGLKDGPVPDFGELVGEIGGILLR